MVIIIAIQIKMTLFNISVIKMHIRTIHLIAFFLIVISIADCGIYQDRYQEAYKIAEAMTLQQKIGQTIQVDFYGVTENGFTDPTQAIKLNLGSLLVGGNGSPDQNGNMVDLPWQQQEPTIKIYANSTLDKWQKLAAKFDYKINVTTNEGKTYSIKPLLATDAVHNDQHVSGTILFPHNIGLSCSHNPENFKNVGKWTAHSLKQTGFNYAFAPTVAVSHNPQWGRFYETMGQESEMIYKYGKAYTQGLQGTPDNLTGILGSVKHFIGDGATLYGADEGNARVSSFKTFVDHNIQGYKGSIEAQIGSVMCSYSGINWLPMSLSPMLNTLLRQNLSFDGLVISDYSELYKVIYQQLPTDLQKFQNIDEAVAQLMMAGIDMIMIGDKGACNDYSEGIKKSLEKNTITMDRLNDAVARILAVKLALGIAQKTSSIRVQEIIKPAKPQKKTINPQQYQDSLNAVHQSLVLLKNNNNLLPVNTNSLKYIVLVGERIINICNSGNMQLFKNYDNIGMQCGGWSLRWNGFQGNSQWLDESKKLTNATSILESLTALNQNFELLHPNYSSYSNQTNIENEREEYLDNLTILRKKMTSSNTLILSVVGESPYAQFSGDAGVPYCEQEGADGCLYTSIFNPYLPTKQRSDLNLNYTEFDQQVIDHIRAQDKEIPLMTVKLAGRPMIIDNILDQSTAFLAAFWPGTSGGQGIVDAITGDYVLRPKGQSDRTNTLSFDWPRSNEQLKDFPIYKEDEKIPQYDDPLFRVGHGISTSRTEVEA